MSTRDVSRQIPAHFERTTHTDALQYNYGENLEKENNDGVFSSSYQKTVNIWSQANQDLPRLGYLEVNEEVIEDNAHNMPATSEQVVDKLLVATNNDEKATQGLTTLLEQTWVPEANALLKEENPNLTFSKVEHKHLVTVDKEKFKVVHESLYRVSHIDPDGIMAEKPQIGYTKTKTVISGSLTDLKEKNIKQIDFKLMNTAERKNEKEARKDQYYGMNPFSSRRKDEDYRSTIS